MICTVLIKVLSYGYYLNLLKQEKVQYYDIATEKRAEFDRAMADYIKRKVFSSDFSLYF